MNNASANEYIDLRNEMRDRIKMLNSQNLTMLAIVLSSWLLAINAIGIIAELYSKGIVESDFGGQLIYMVYLFTGVAFNFPTFIMAPLAVRNGDNLFQICSIAQYMKAYYEYPSKFHGKKLISWERIQYKGLGFGKVRRFFFCLEYFIVALISTIIQAVYFGVLCNIEKEYCTITLIIMLIFLMLAGLILFFIYRASSVSINMFNKAKELLNRFVHNAVVDGVLTEDEGKRVFEEEMKHEKLCDWCIWYQK